MTAAAATHPDPLVYDALADLLQLGLAVARTAARLAEVEGQAIDALGDAAVDAVRAMAATPRSLAEAIDTGKAADISDAARDGIATRLTTITAAFDTAARAVRRTAALMTRLTQGRPFRDPPARPSGATAPRPPEPRTPRPANDADPRERGDREDRPDWGDEIAHLTDEEVLASIHRDLQLTPPGDPGGPGPASPDPISPDAYALCAHLAELDLPTPPPQPGGGKQGAPPKPDT